MTVRVAVLGCGAIGSLYAAHLARVPDVEVWAVDPLESHMRAVARDGMRVTGLSDFVAPVHALTDASALPQCDFGIVATKAVHTRDAMEAARHALLAATVTSLQNGLGNEEVVAEVVPLVARGSIVPAGHVTAPGVVNLDGAGETWLGPFESSPAPMDEIGRLADLMTAGGLHSTALDDVRGQQWTKVVFNAATSPLAALTGLTVGQVCTDAGLRIQVERLIDEALAVADAAGITVLSDPRHSVDEAIETAFWHKPSMLQDVQARRVTEIDVINGGVAAEGARAGVPTPGHDAMVALVRALESSWHDESEQR